MIALHIYIYLKLFKMFFMKSYWLNNYFLDLYTTARHLSKKTKKNTELNEAEPSDLYLRVFAHFFFYFQNQNLCTTRTAWRSQTWQY